MEAISVSFLFTTLLTRLKEMVCTGDTEEILKNLMMFRSFGLYFVFPFSVAVNLFSVKCISPEIKRNWKE